MSLQPKLEKNLLNTVKNEAAFIRAVKEAKVHSVVVMQLADGSFRMTDGIVTIFYHRDRLATFVDFLLRNGMKRSDIDSNVFTRS